MKDEDLKALVHYRLERARSALHDAESILLCDGSPEGVINRAYYAMFYSVLALFQNLEKVPRKHSGVISLFDREFYKTGIFPKELSKNLHRAFELRQKSDYQDLVTMEWDTARHLFHKASCFVDTIEGYEIKSGFPETPTSGGVTG